MNESPQKPPVEEPETKNSKVGKNALEWTVFSLSLLLVTATFGWLVSQALRQNATPPRLEISLGAPLRAGKRVLVPVKVENRGDATAAGVEVEVERKGSEETAGFSFSHLPRGGSREGWVAFDAPLDKKELSAKIIGYEEP